MPDYSRRFPLQRLMYIKHSHWHRQPPPV